ncbi:MAG: protein kinase, partial [Candidatus Omnitrophica bacterium]|nr:protein kinase [Candidatus Omnitrophota bacterium]
MNTDCSIRRPCAFRERVLKSKTLKLGILLLFSFQSAVFSGTAWAQQPVLDHRQSLKHIEIPEKIGFITEIYSPENASGGKTLFILQDPHNNVKAQFCTAEIYDYLMKNYKELFREGYPFVAMEGDPPMELNYSVFTEFPAKEVLRDVSDILVREGRLDGTEYYKVNYNPETRILGIEDESRYFENVMAYKRAERLKKESQFNVRDFRKAFDELKRRAYSYFLKQLDASIRSFEDHPERIKEHFASLEQIAKAKGISLGSFPAFQTMKSLIENENKIVKPRLNDELSKLGIFQAPFGFDSRQEGRKFLDQLNKAIEHIPYNPEDFPETEKYRAYLEATLNLRAEEFFGDLEKIYQTLIQTLAQSDRERIIADHDRKLSLLEKMWNFEVTDVEYEYFKTVRAEVLDVEYWKKLNPIFSEYLLPFRITDQFYEATLILREAERFYEAAIARNDALLKNTLKQMDKAQVSSGFVVVGGFHAEGITSLLRKKNMPYVLIVPQVGVEEDQTLYWKTLSGTRTSLEKLIRFYTAKAVSLLGTGDAPTVKAAAMFLLAHPAARQIISNRDQLEKYISTIQDPDGKLAGIIRSAKATDRGVEFTLTSAKGDSIQVAIDMNKVGKETLDQEGFSASQNIPGQIQLVFPTNNPDEMFRVRLSAPMDPESLQGVTRDVAENFVKRMNEIRQEFNLGPNWSLENAAADADPHLMRIREGEKTFDVRLLLPSEATGKDREAFQTEAAKGAVTAQIPLQGSVNDTAVFQYQPVETNAAVRHIVAGEGQAVVGRSLGIFVNSKILKSEKINTPVGYPYKVFRYQIKTQENPSGEDVIVRYPVISTVTLQEQKDDLEAFKSEIIRGAADVKANPEFIEVGEVKFNGAKTAYLATKASGDPIVASDTTRKALKEILGNSNNLPEYSKLKGREVEKVEFVAGGGMGDVFKVTLRAVDGEPREIALKIPKSENLIRSFVRELDATKKSQVNQNTGEQNKAVIQLYGAGTVRLGNVDWPFMETEFVQGDDLLNFLRKNQADMSMDKKLELAQKVAAAVGEYHQSGLIHRDLKPQNILIQALPDRGFVVKIADYGFAGDLSTVRAATSTMGTPLYTSPENAKRKFNQLNKTTDVYSLGATLYQMFADRPPLNGTTAQDFLRRLVNDELPPKASAEINSKKTPANRFAGPVFLERLDQILDRARDSNPRYRYQNADQVANDLNQLRDIYFGAYRNVAERRQRMNELRRAIDAEKSKIGRELLGGIGITRASSLGSFREVFNNDLGLFRYPNAGIQKISIPGLENSTEVFSVRLGADAGLKSPVKAIVVMPKYFSKNPGSEKILIEQAIQRAARNYQQAPDAEFVGAAQFVDKSRGILPYFAFQVSPAETPQNIVNRVNQLLGEVAVAKKILEAAKAETLAGPSQRLGKETVAPPGQGLAQQAAQPQAAQRPSSVSLRLANIGDIARSVQPDLVRGLLTNVLNASSYLRDRKVKGAKFFAAGGMGEIYKVDFEGEPSVLIKIPKMPAGDINGDQADVNQEIEGVIDTFDNDNKGLLAVQQINPETSRPYEGVVKLLEASKVGTAFPYSIMAVAPGQNLTDFIQNNLSLPLSDKIKLMRAILKSFGELHQMGILHRDIKPDNIIVERVGNDFKATIIDMGLSVSEQDVPNLSTGFAVGTPRYMSPEQAYGQNNTLTGTSDVYALGAVFYELLTGKPVIDGDDVMAVLRNVGSGQAAGKKPSEGILTNKQLRLTLGPSIRDMTNVLNRLDQITAKALSPGIPNRFGTVQQFDKALEVLQKQAEYFMAKQIQLPKQEAGRPAVSNAPTEITKAQSLGAEQINPDTIIKIETPERLLEGNFDAHEVEYRGPEGTSQFAVIIEPTDFRQKPDDFQHKVIAAFQDIEARANGTLETNILELKPGNENIALIIPLRRNAFYEELGKFEKSYKNILRSAITPEQAAPAEFVPPEFQMPQAVQGKKQLLDPRLSNGKHPFVFQSILDHSPLFQGKEIESMTHLGAGGMGEIYQISVRENDQVKTYAVKVPLVSPDEYPGNLAGPRQAIEALQREAGLLKEASAVSGVVPFRDSNAVDYADGRGDSMVDANGELLNEGKIPYLVMDFVQGKKADTFFNETNLSPVETIKLFAKIARTFSKLHQLGLIHLDIKPDNILIQEVLLPDGSVDYEPQIIDFGVSLRTGEVPGQTSEVIRGTPQYMSPEQAGLANNQLSNKSDIFGLSATFFGLLTGNELPWRVSGLGVQQLIASGEYADEVNLRHLYDTGMLRYNETLRNALSENELTQLDGILQKGLLRNPEQRYPTAVDLADALERFARSIETPAVENAPEVAVDTGVPDQMGVEGKSLGVSIEDAAALRQIDGVDENMIKAIQDIAARNNLANLVWENAADPAEKEKYWEKENKDVQLFKVIGTSGFGRILVLGIDKEEMAIKIPVNISNAEALQDFKDEVVISENLKRNPKDGVVKILKTSGVNETPYIAMEFLKGSNMESESKKPLAEYSLDQRIGDLVLAAKALRDIHAVGYVHNDVKPLNFMKTQGPENKEVIKIIDPGTAGATSKELNTKFRMQIKEVSKKGLQPVLTRILGSPAYSAPETLLGIPFGKDAKKRDVYSFGVSMYEVLTGRKPFQPRPDEVADFMRPDAQGKRLSETEAKQKSLLSQIIADEPADFVTKPSRLLGELNPEITAEIERIIFK